MEFKDDHDDAIPTDKVKNLISRLILKDNLILTIISGRTVGNLLKFFTGIDIQKINWVGIHGAQIKYKNSNIRLTDGVRETLHFIKNLREQVSKIIKDINCFRLEDKKESFAVHYRKCRGDDLIYLHTITGLIDSFIKDKPLDYLKMNKVIEVKPKGINKGRAFEAIRKKYKNPEPSINICIGDDVTDKFLFERNQNGINIKVGNSSTEIINAEYFLKNVNDVYDFLEYLLPLL